MKDFLIVRNFVSKEQCQTMFELLDSLYSKNLYLNPDNQCVLSPAFYGVFNDQSLEFLPSIEKLVNKKLNPTYTYARIYQPAELLLPHVDRDECEYSFTLTLKCNPTVWPFFIKTQTGIVEAILDVGDILIYKGIENLHWRMRYNGVLQHQAFFHYVDQDGLYANKKYDGREKFATSNESIEELIRKKHVLQ